MRRTARPHLPDARTIRLLVTVLSIVGLIAGCSSLPQLGKGEDGATRDVEAAAESPRGDLVYYAAEDGLNVYAEPSANARVVAELPLHERVLRSEVSRGYAKIRTADERVQGWVDNARLLWRLPDGQPLGQPAAADEGTAGPAQETPEGETSSVEALSSDVPQADSEPQARTLPSPQTSTRPAADQSARPRSTEPPVEAQEKPEPSVFNPF